MKKFKVFASIVVLFLVSTYIALPAQIAQIDFYFLGRHINPQFELKKGLDIQGGMQVVLGADMSQVDPDEKEQAIRSVRQIISNRVDQYGLAESKIQTAKVGDDYRLIIELPGVEDQQQALQLVGQTAQLEFKLQTDQPQDASPSAALALGAFESTDITGKDLKRANLSFDPNTGEPTVALEFNATGTKKFAQITKENEGKVLAIFLDQFPIALPRINQAILDGQAVMTGDFTVEEAQNIAIQLNAGALPVPIEVLEQKAIGASLGEESVQQSVKAGVIGLALVGLFMTLYYGWRGVLASLALVIYASLTISSYKLLGVTLTLPGIAGLLLTIGMAVDLNILTFERMKEELRSGREFEVAMESSFGRAWDNIKDANVASILTALVLINPFDFGFLSTSGLVRGFGLTLLMGLVISLFTGLIVTRNLMRVFLPLVRKRRIIKKVKTK